MISVVYFNQWFSSIAPVIADIKQKMGNSVKIIASSKNPEHAYKDVVDEFIVEDWEEGETSENTERNYISFCLNICKQYNVDYFFVKKNAKLVAKNSSSFSKLGVKLVLNDYSVIDKTESKGNVYRTLEKELKDSYNYLIPEYYQYGTDKNCELDYAKLKDIIHRCESENWCLKLDNDEGGASFRKIKNLPVTIDSLKRFRVNEVTIKEVYSLINSIGTDSLKKLLFMEMLDEPEISVDCYNSKYGFISICREKLPNSRVQRIYFNQEMTCICENIGKIYGFNYPFNVQFRVKQGGNRENIRDLRLLEINPRMSGGTYYSTLYNMNIAEQVLLDEMGISKPSDFSKFIDFTDKRVTFVEQAIKLD